MNCEYRVERWSLPGAFTGALEREGDGLEEHEVPVGFDGDKIGVEDDATASSMPLTALEQLHHALETMQTHYFELWLGTWPEAIDWTAAVVGTYMSSTLHSLTRSLEYVLEASSNSPRTSPIPIEGQRIENEINKYFSQSVAYYFGENAFEIRTQAYDDMLWVVLGWLENIRFIDLHSAAHYKKTEGDDDEEKKPTWYGLQFRNAFAHRARVFYNLASDGWDTSLCGGGMVWNPHLEPYKNAITNELYISASTAMYLYFPGDDNDSPFLTSSDQPFASSNPPTPDFTTPLLTHPPQDPRFLTAARTAYTWLKSSNMTNALGLYTDGFHIHNWTHTSPGTAKCDNRNEMVYTYNQGVLLTGLRGLWESTGDLAYLEDGHALIRNVINATGWKDVQGHVDATSGLLSPAASAAITHAPWSGLGRAGILEESCDASATCSQDGQTFKGIFFHHLTEFCEPLPAVPRIPGKTWRADPWFKGLHRSSCREYAVWVTYNAQAALRTRRKGMFGGWWGQGVEGAGRAAGGRSQGLGKGAVDYRNGAFGTGNVRDEWVWGVERGKRLDWERVRERDRERDPNDMGRGRTVETQGGGVAVVRAMWEFIRNYEKEEKDVGPNPDPDFDL
ncbi:glycoside hydrolase family 76 protein [Aulographum hederae CBS 113979]|uniref:Glycoside hydrolase family 76 protein n=1 Tax=Aulographum hederae CBS 113979 TaxID=1176131 RepID=A0A6G1GL49_9PEZI|nr:glycoside hydrolase family 76 protein [Aulographum hederae CBS 113979]